ncbi:hypothetical protein BS47DRAFT_825456 [Hydnum rufescens UP504]|uniref:Uncharacterized protein n=1 Tax=Hydnum rufescens UP504 TaxID=1448309 RepID=A0A9P6B070_9AGAM|nr:hypothetical protein BS47DRAFT_825456 [Hydnum rufescens UP504]
MSPLRVRGWIVKALLSQAGRLWSRFNIASLPFPIASPIVDFEPIVEGSFGSSRTQILLMHTSDPNPSRLSYVTWTPVEKSRVHALQFGLSGGEAPDCGCFPTIWGDEVVCDWKIYSVKLCSFAFSFRMGYLGYGSHCS